MWPHYLYTFYNMGYGLSLNFDFGLIYTEAKYIFFIFESFDVTFGDRIAQTTFTPSGTLIFGTVIKNLVWFTKIQTPTPGWLLFTFSCFWDYCETWAREKLLQRILMPFPRFLPQYHLESKLLDGFAERVHLFVQRPEVEAGNEGEVGEVRVRVRVNLHCTTHIYHEYSRITQS